MKPNDTTRPKKTCGFDKTSRAKRRSAALDQENEEKEPKAGGQTARENGKRGRRGKRGRKNASKRSSARKKNAPMRRTAGRAPQTQSA
jgi:hypothetical protein